MDPGADAGFGGMGGPDGISGSGDFGGDFGGPDFGGYDTGRAITISNPKKDRSALINADLNAFFGDVDSAEAAMQGKSKAADKVVDFIMGKLKGIPFLGTAIEVAQLALDVQKDLGVKVSSDQVNAVVNGLNSGEGPDKIARGLRNDMGIKNAKIQKAYDPKNNQFWKDFVDEWQEAKSNIKANDQFRKDKMQPAFENYRERLLGLSNEPTFKPINVKMGDFQTSFMPNRAVQNAQNVLSSQLAETDIMQPKRAEQNYLNQLMGLAQWQQEMKNKINLTENSKVPDDQGGWLDIINDTIKVGKGATELWDMFKK